MILNMDKIQFESRAEIGTIVTLPRPFARTRVGVSPMQRRCFARATHFSNRALES